MKTIIIIVFTLFCTNCIAQITITESDMPASGDTLRFSNALPSQSIDLTQTGANYTWDFSQLTPLTQHIDTFFAVSALPKSYKVIFAGASFATHTNVPDSIGTITLTDVYTMYTLNSSEFGELGVGEEIDGLPTPIKYDSTDILYTFPLNYSNVDSSLSGYSLSVPTLLFTSETRDRVNHCDGWGTLTTPYGTFSVLRVVSTLIENDSVYLDSLSKGFSISTTTYQYKWLAKGEGEPMLEIDAQDVLGMPVIETVTYRDSVRNKTTGIDLATAGRINIFPNPASDKIYVTGTNNSSAQIQLKIFSVYGNLVYQQNGLNATTTSIDVSKFSAGTYIAELIQGGEILHNKFIVAH